ncbi:hypothetical protein GP486_007650 [Trichoglossum hirsutum]|uniref:Protein YOP1 n=1 Tax=Trichoglossum hirsutum TaxID=265104 RepID=A0A9P8IH80_9PEZI|nr:hypothetical protein GP486_007650 [Trichoglossum hirsutum]
MDTRLVWAFSTLLLRSTQPLKHPTDTNNRRLRLSRIPFYAWIRLFILLYLVLPQTQGAKLVYIKYIHPFLRDHEAEIEAFLAKSHERARAAGLQYYSQAADAVREFLGMEPRQAQPPTAPPTTAQNTGAYVQNLLSRFDLPSAAAAAASFLQQQQQQFSTTTTTTTLPTFPPYLQPRTSETPSQRLAFLTAQRARFLSILQSLDREAQALNVEASSPPHPRSEPTDGQGLKKSKSESEFERVEREDVGVGGEEGRGNASGGGGGGWMPWSWGAKPMAVTTQELGGEQGEMYRGSATGVDTPGDFTSFSSSSSSSSPVQYRHGRWQGQS